MITKKYYIDLSSGENGAWVDNPQDVADKSNLVIVTDIHFSFASRTESDPDPKADEDQRREVEGRPAKRITSILCHISYQTLNRGDAGALVYPVCDVTQMLVETDDKGNQTNKELTKPEEVPSVDEIKDLILEVVSKHVKSVLRGLQEQTIIRQAVAKLNEDFSLLIK